MRVYAVVCEKWLRGKHSVHVIGVYRREVDARTALGEDETSIHLGAHLDREIVEVELE